MKPLDELYGAGASASFARAAGPDGRRFGRAEVEEIALKNGNVRVNVEWGRGSLMKIECSPKAVRFATLRSETEGLYTTLCGSLPKWAKDHGVEVFESVPEGSVARSVLLKRGRWQAAARLGDEVLPGGERLRWEL